MKITLKHYHWTCGEPGCCDEYGVNLFIDGEEIKERTFCDSWEAYEYVLKEILGHEIEEEDTYD